MKCIAKYVRNLFNYSFTYYYMDRNIIFNLGYY